MGQLLGLMKNDHNAVSLVLNLNNPEPSDSEKEIYDIVNEVLVKKDEILDKLMNYSGCENSIRAAITSPTPETEEAAWKAVLPAVDQLQEFYDYSLELENCFPKLFVSLCKEDPKNTLENQQALAKQLAEVFDFVLKFDDMKMVNPSIQNDFSYYRRTLNRMKIGKQDANIKIRDELANRMSLFFAYPTPMMKVLSETTAKFLETSGGDAVPKEHVTNVLSLIANICHEMVHSQHFENDKDIDKEKAEELNMFCLRAMTGSIILYDHIHEQGAFARRSPINIKACVQVLKSYGESHSNANGTNPTDGFLNALRFTTVHLNDQETPGAIKQLLQ